MKTIVSVVLFFLSFNLFGTIQKPDYLTYNNKKYNLYSNPLEIYFNKHPKKRPKAKLRSSGLRRGYIATFEIKNNLLIIQDIKVRADEGSKSMKEEVLENESELKSTWYQKIVKNFHKKDFIADWFTGILVFPYDKIISLVHIKSRAFRPKNYILLQISKGKLVKEKDLTIKDYQLFKEVQFSKFKKTEEYKKISKEMVDKGSTKKFVDNFLRHYIIRYTSEFLDKK